MRQQHAVQHWAKWSTCRRWQTVKVLGIVGVSRTLPAAPLASQYTYPQHFALERWQFIQLAVNEGFKYLSQESPLRGRSSNASRSCVQVIEVEVKEGVIGLDQCNSLFK